MLDAKTRELIALGCAVTANCHPCVRFHLDKARGLGIAAEDIDAALRIGVMVRRGAADQMDELITELTGTGTDDVPGCDIPRT